MNQEKAKAGTEGDESLLERAEEALVGDHPDEAETGAKDRDSRKDTKEKPFLKSP
jgi:hypothetical protein